MSGATSRPEEARSSAKTCLKTTGLRTAAAAYPQHRGNEAQQTRTCHGRTPARRPGPRPPHTMPHTSRPPSQRQKQYLNSLSLLCLTLFFYPRTVSNNEAKENPLEKANPGRYKGRRDDLRGRPGVRTHRALPKDPGKLPPTLMCFPCLASGPPCRDTVACVSIRCLETQVPSHCGFPGNSRAHPTTQLVN